MDYIRTMHRKYPTVKYSEITYISKLYTLTDIDLVHCLFSSAHNHTLRCCYCCCCYPRILQIVS